jgi:ComF family protein
MIKELSSLLFPVLCYACGESIGQVDRRICISCLQEFPRTDFYKSKNNLVEKKFWGRVKIEKGTSFLYFQGKGKVQQLIHKFKYDGHKEIGISLGSWAASELLEDGFFDGIDLLVPMPIHGIKKEIRGFNQSDLIVEGVSKVTRIEAKYNLVKKEANTSSQTRKSRFRRWKNVKSTFRVIDSQPFKGKHILLVDDVITTGATIEACAIEILKIPNVKLSILSIAMTY